MIDLQKLRDGDRRTLAKAITLVESTRDDHRLQAENLLEQVMPESGCSLRLGISGSPGVGKSTFIDALGRLLIGEGKKVAVLSVDPSSSISGGAILGDKTRMNWLSMQPDAFIRPSPSGMTLGGVSRRTRESILLCEAAGYDLVIVETVGVGQSETLVSEMTDLFLVMLLPGAGDDLQGIKRGIMELADLVIVNKADGDLKKRARLTEADIRNALQLLRPRLTGWTTPVLSVSSLESVGIDLVRDKIREFRQCLEHDDGLSLRRSGQSMEWLRRETGEMLIEILHRDQTVEQEISKLQEQVRNGTVPASVAAARLARNIFHGQRIGQSSQ